ncbi:GNAT family N-acetyltransferase [Plantactinospora sp. KBS50]|nr:GNAT family N-acetyltransferase [Plantactinospora sp. KBS50]
MRVPDARRATVADVDELVRLRAVMLAGMADGAPDGGAPDGGEWRRGSAATLRTRLAEPDPTLAAFVVDRDGTGALAACAVGTVELRLGGPDNPSGRVGHVFNVATDPDRRRRGYSRACVSALLDWFRAADVRRIDLRASAEGEPLYRSLGFVRTRDPAMRLRGPGAGPPA